MARSEVDHQRGEHHVADRPDAHHVRHLQVLRGRCAEALDHGRRIEVGPGAESCRAGSRLLRSPSCPVARTSSATCSAPSGASEAARSSLSHSRRPSELSRVREGKRGKGDGASTHPRARHPGRGDARGAARGEPASELYSRAPARCGQAIARSTIFWPWLLPRPFSGVACAGPGPATCCSSWVIPSRLVSWARATRAASIQRTTVIRWTR